MGMDKSKYKVIYVPLDLHAKLLSRKRPHQALAGVIEELLSEVEKTPSDKSVELSPDGTK